MTNKGRDNEALSVEVVVKKDIEIEMLRGDDNSIILSTKHVVGAQILKIGTDGKLHLFSDINSTSGLKLASDGSIQIAKEKL